MTGLRAPEGFTWGQEALIQVEAPNRSTRVQVCSIQNPFPDSWRFLLWGEVLQSDPGVGIVLEFELFTGIGQTTADLTRAGTGFQQLRWNPGSSARAPKWSTEFLGPLRDDTDANSAVRGDVIVGKTIIVSAVVSQNPSVAPSRIRVATLFAPNASARAR